MWFVFDITVNGEHGFCEIVDEKGAEGFYKKELFKSENKSECEEFAHKNFLKIKNYENIKPVNNDLWSDF